MARVVCWGRSASMGGGRGRGPGRLVLSRLVGRCRQGGEDLKVRYPNFQIFAPRSHSHLPRSIQALSFPPVFPVEAGAVDVQAGGGKKGER